MKRYLLLAATIMMMLSILLTACRGTDTDSSDNANAAETTAVLETTADGGTIEQDADGNVITKDSTGVVIAVEDKNGVSLDVSEYLSTHSTIQGNTPSGGSSAGDSKSGGSSKKDNNSSDSIDDDAVEESIPVIVATIPDDEDIIDLSDI